MKSNFKHITAVIVLITTLINTILPFQAFGENVASVQFDGTQSSWAEPEIKEAYELTLTYSDVMSNFKKNITREEFCTLVIKLYEKLTGKIPSAETDPFKDTDNEEILKAYGLGIVKGTSADSFSPANNITRQEICVMISRALTVSIPNLNNDSTVVFPFKDSAKIASWAIDAMKFAYKNEIMKGVSADTIDPLSNTTREQGIVLLLRTYKKYSGATTKGTVKIEPGPKPITNNQKKYEFMVNANNIFFPKFDERIELFVSNKAGKPSTLPIFSAANANKKYYKAYAAILNPITVPNMEIPDLEVPDMPEIKFQPAIKERPTVPVYTKSDFGAFIDKSGDKVRWFAFNLNNATNASKVLWQVSTTQFSGFKDNFKTQPGIVMSGEVSVSSKEFSVDFGKITNSILQSRFSGSNAFKPIAQKQKTYYVRAVPVDNLGSPIGDPGKGIAVLYGETMAAVDENTDSKFELWTPKSYLGSYGSENNDEPRHDPYVNGNIVTVDPKYTTTRLFHFHNIDDKTKKIVIQVFNEDFNAEQDYSNKANIVYEKEYIMPVSNSNLPTTEYTPSILIPFDEFGKNVSEMVEKQYIDYYVRGIAIKEDEQPGRDEISYSDIVNVKYGFGEPVTIIGAPSKYNKTEKIGLSIPSISIVGYKAAEWADPDYLSHFYVFRKPEPKEIFCSWMDLESKEILEPYYSVVMNPLVNDNLTDAEYQKIIDRVLPVGTRVYIPKPVEKDKEWYEELFDGVVGFFKDIASTVAKIYNKIRQTYENLKASLIEAVVSLCPFPELRGYFAAALEGLISYGLASIGIPPTFPNFDKLAEDNIAYFAQLALTEAGVPPNEITDELTEKVAGQMVDEFVNSNKTSDENPISAPFLKFAPEFLYKPAYVEIEIENNTNYPTVSGFIDLNVQFKLDESGIYATSYDPTGLDLTNDTNQYGYDPYGYGLVTAVDYRKHFIYGLNGYTVNYLLGEEAIYEVFKPIVNQKIPVIPPNTTQKLKIYLEPGGFASASRYPTTEGSRYEDFYNMYFNNGNKDYTWFVISQYFPSAEQYLLDKAAKENTIFLFDSKTDYEYTNEHTYSGYGHGQLMQMPVSQDW